MKCVLFVPVGYQFLDYRLLGLLLSPPRFGLRRITGAKSSNSLYTDLLLGVETILEIISVSSVLQEALADPGMRFMLMVHGGCEREPLSLALVTCESDGSA